MSPISITQAHDGIALANYRWPPTSRAPARGIYLLHGLSEYAGRYEHVAEWLNERDWVVAAHDHRGHGRSGGPRAWIRHDDDLVRDAEQSIAAFAEHIGQPPILLGHSMGGLIAAQVALRGKIPLAGLVLCSPAFALPLRQATRSLLRGLRHLAPRLPLLKRRKHPRLTHDQVVAANYAQDPLVNRYVTPRLAQMIADAGPQVVQRAPELGLRTLLLVAGDDHVVDARGSQAFAEAAPPGKIAMRWYESAWHELLNETQELAKPVYIDLETWLAGV